MSASSTNRTRNLTITGGVGVAAVAGAIMFFFAGEAPDTVDIDDAVAQAEQDATATEAPGAGTAEGGPVDPQGTWAVDTATEPFDFATSAGTFLGFRIDEELTTVGATEAVGRTPTVTGELTLEGSVVTAATFTGDVTDLTTDVTRRDSRARSAMGAAENPLITFVLREPIELGAEPAAGETFTATAVGDLTINGITRQVEAPLQAALASTGLLVVTSSFEVTLADHAITAPKAGPVVSVADVATVEVQLYLTRS